MAIHQQRSSFNQVTIHSSTSPTTNSSPSPCKLPPDFWCDDPTAALACTGGRLEYCEAYNSQHPLKLDIKLAFETGCPDSQKLIVDRLYPRVLRNPELAQFIHFKAFPWGLARRQYDDQNTIRCHHGPRECVGNRLLSCALSHYQWDPVRRDRILYCFMDHMMARGDPEQGMEGCLAKAWAGPAIIGQIMGCAQSAQANALQMDDERGTGQILFTRPRFVPFLSLNGKSNIHMQAPLQLILPEKIRHWNRTVNKNLRFGLDERARIPKSLPQREQQCEFPPEFWCSDPIITRACFSTQLCRQFGTSNFGRPIHLRIIYNSQFVPSREYLLNYLAGRLMNRNAAKFGENAGKMVVQLEPAHFTRRALAECGVGRREGGGMARGCNRRIMEICIGTIVEPMEERNRLLICLNSIQAGDSGQQEQETAEKLVINCQPEAANRERILYCANNERIWMAHNAQLALQQNQRALAPEPRRTDPWILLNGYSLSTVQNYANVLDYMICLWYTGPGHDREKCGRCEYEPTHC